jgi:hypothetical protein
VTAGRSVLPGSNGQWPAVAHTRRHPASHPTHSLRSCRSSAGASPETGVRRSTSNGGVRLALDRPRWPVMQRGPLPVSSTIDVQQLSAGNNRRRRSRPRHGAHPYVQPRADTRLPHTAAHRTQFRNPPHGWAARLHHCPVRSRRRCSPRCPLDDAPRGSPSPGAQARGSSAETATISRMPRRCGPTPAPSR